MPPKLTAGRTLLVVTVLGFANPTTAPAQEPGEAQRLARRLLDDQIPQAEREAIVRDHPTLSAPLLASLTDGLTPGTKEEYRRIPWVWRVTVAAGRRHDEGELRRLLDLALPKPGAPLDDWRAVVLGGGLVNGITLGGAWPGERIEAALKGHDALAARWREALTRAEAMADDPKVPTGTRYDALRLVGVEPWDRSGARLFRYLVKGVDPELQQGAVCALGDVPAPPAAVAQALLSGIGHYTEGNRAFALEALVRDEGRALVLLDALAGKTLSASSLGPKCAEALKRHPAPAVRDRAAGLLGR